MSTLVQLLEVGRNAGRVYAGVLGPEHLNELIREELLAQLDRVLSIDGAVGGLDLTDVLEHGWDVLKELLEVAARHRSQRDCERMVIVLVGEVFLWDVNFFEERLTCLLCLPLQVAIWVEHALRCVEVELDQASQERSEASQERFPECVFL